MQITMIIISKNGDLKANQKIWTKTKNRHINKGNYYQNFYEGCQKLMIRLVVFKEIQLKKQENELPPVSSMILIYLDVNNALFLCIQTALFNCHLDKHFLS